jgi:type I restriction enzyme S subunit
MVVLSSIVTELESGSRPKGGIKDEISGIPSLGAEHLNNNGGFNLKKIKHIPKTFFESQKRGVIRPQDILIVKDGATTGKVSFVGSDFPFELASINEHVFRLRVDNDSAVAKYVYYFLSTPKGKKQILKDFRGATVGGISRGFIDKVTIPLPDISIQQSIVERLDKVVALHEKRTDSIKLLDIYMDSLFFEMFGDPVTNTMGWENVALGKLLESMTSGSRGWAKYFSEQGDYFITIKNVGRNKRLLLENVTRVIAPDNAEANRTRVRENDILMSITADLGRTAVVPKLDRQAFINQHLVILRLNKNINPTYISHYLSSGGGQRQMMSSNKGAAKAGLNFNDIRNIKVLLPPLELQNKYVQIISKSEKMRLLMTEQLKEFDQLSQSLMQNVFAEPNNHKIKKEYQI